MSNIINEFQNQNLITKDDITLYVYKWKILSSSGNAIIAANPYEIKFFDLNHTTGEYTKSVISVNDIKKAKVSILGANISSSANGKRIETNMQEIKIIPKAGEKKVFGVAWKLIDGTDQKEDIKALRQLFKTHYGKK